MSEVNDKDLKKEIEKILLKASEESKGTSLKSVRLELEKKFNVELKDRKDFISKTIEECIKKMEEESEEEEESATEDKEADDEQSEEEDKKPPKRAAAKAKAAPKPKRKKKSEDDDEDADFGKKKKKSRGAGKGNGYTRAWKLSPALSELLGEEEMPRYEVVKRMWALIKEKNLYDPNNKQFALCDDALYSVIGIKRFRIFAMMKYLKNHFLDD